MVRATSKATTARRKKRTRKLTKGFRLSRHNLYRQAIVTLIRALRQRFDKHKRIARWTLPLWLYVSVTGVVIYFLLYQIFPQH